MTYLENLIAARDSILAAVIAQGAYGSYARDGESWSARDLSQLQTLEDLILREQNRVSGRRELRVVRGRRFVAWR